MNISNTWFGAITGWTTAVVIVRAVPWVLHKAGRVTQNNGKSSIEDDQHHPQSDPPPAGSPPKPSVE